MSLNIGARLGPYEVLSVIGAGGMGEVYRARDVNLHREVALKVLPAAVADNPRRLVRFEREARALAALNHPNIAAVYGIEHSEPAGSKDPALQSRGTFAIVMELVAGEDLSARLKRGAMPQTDVLAIARQVAEALAAAHDAGIVHRDLKPANIRVREDGTVKVLDFGLAQSGTADAGAGAGSASGSGSGSGDPLRTLTLGADLTEDGAVLGTAAYMAPEQAKGKLIDKRADIWSFGVVLFEMLAGQRPFVASDATDMIAHVLTTEPAWAALPADTPPPIRRLLARCLTKDRKHRLHDIGDARLEIDEAIAPQLPGEWPAPVIAPVSGRLARGLTLALLGVLAGVTIGFAVWNKTQVAPAVIHARLDVGPAAELDSGGVHPAVVLAPAGARTAFAWSPNGQTLAFVALKGGVRQAYVRDLASDVARPLAGTEGAGALTFSPSGDEIAFFADGAIRKVNVAGGPVTKICNAGAVSGIHWGPTRIVFGQGSLSEVSPAGGDLRAINEFSELVRYASPFLLPGDMALLYTEYDTQWTSGGERVMVRSLAPGAVPKVLLSAAADARYLSTGHIAFLRQGTLFVVPFDAQALELRGEAVAVLKDVAQAVVAWDSDDLTLAGQFAISPQGTLAYVSSPLSSYPDRELVTVDRRGRIASLGAPLKGYRNHIDVSPDGTRLGVSIQTTSDIRPYAYDLARRTLSRMADSLKGEVILAAWSKNNRVAFQVIQAGKISAVIGGPDVAAPTVPMADPGGFWVSSLSPAGRLVGMKDGRVWIYSPDEDNAHLTEFVMSRANETQPVWSPDGTWLAYTSDTTGRPEVYVRPFPGPGEAVMVSTNGGSGPAWNPNGREVFYLEPGSSEDRMMAVALISPGRPGKSVALFPYARAGLFLGTIVLTPYAVAPDGLRFYAVRNLPQTSAPVTQINVILNWFEKVMPKVTAGR